MCIDILVHSIFQHLSPTQVREATLLQRSLFAEDCFIWFFEHKILMYMYIYLEEWGWLIEGAGEIVRE